MKVTQAELPKITRENRATLPPEVVKEVKSDLADSFNFQPHAYTDGKEYPTYADAQKVVNITIREAAQALEQPENMFRRRVWEKGGEKDRTKKGKWIFAVTRRTEPPKPRVPKGEQAPAAA